jgi:hypothetical protein
MSFLYYFSLDSISLFPYISHNTKPVDNLNNPQPRKRGIR